MGAGELASVSRERLGVGGACLLRGQSTQVTLAFKCLITKGLFVTVRHVVFFFNLTNSLLKQTRHSKGERQKESCSFLVGGREQIQLQTEQAVGQGPSEPGELTGSRGYS